MPKCWPWKKIGLIALAAAFVVLAASLAMPAAYEICGPDEYTHVKECAQYHLPQFIFVWTVGIGDAHNGLITALASIVVAAFTWALVKLGRDADRHFKVTERAYIKLSHFPPGLLFNDPANGWHVNIRVKNFGRTPARTTAFSLEGIVFESIKDVPARPRYTKRARSSAFLVTEDQYINGVWRSLSAADKADIKSANKSLLVYGYVDYVDQFGVTHRSGYARIYDPMRDNKPATMSDEDFAARTNLLFIDYPSGYNFDLPISARQWDEVLPDEFRSDPHSRLREVE